jgi:hypothetical protein
VITCLVIAPCIFNISRDDIDGSVIVSIIILGILGGAIAGYMVAVSDRISELEKVIMERPQTPTIEDQSTESPTKE